MLPAPGKVKANKPMIDRLIFVRLIGGRNRYCTGSQFTSEGKIERTKTGSQSDLIIASYKPGDAEKLGVSYQQLKSINEKLIYGQITGYGSDNDRVGYDAVIQAESGFMDLNGEAEGNPTKMPVALIDVLAGSSFKRRLATSLC
jgi:crotonobetainyl-CoA:carnitine CoA-transferase CaiB-like acyl-CoA transferase